MLFYFKNNNIDIVVASELIEKRCKVHSWLYKDCEMVCGDITNENVYDSNTNEFKYYFNEIMIDEYQDSNLVQEYLLQSISKEKLGEHNRFMVGDLKQSIYRFRNANPNRSCRTSSLHYLSVRGSARG